MKFYEAVERAEDSIDWSTATPMSRRRKYEAPWIDDALARYNETWKSKPWRLTRVSFLNDPDAPVITDDPSESPDANRCRVMFRDDATFMRLVGDDYAKQYRNENVQYLIDHGHEVSKDPTVLTLGLREVQSLAPRWRADLT